MSVRTRDWLKFGALVAMAFIFGLAFASALDLPTRGAAAERAAVVVQSGPLRQIPAAKPAADLGDAFAAVADHVRPAVVFIKASRRERASARRLPPGFEDFFQIPRRPQVERGTGSGFIVTGDGYILTNNHVVQGADQVTVRLLDNREFPARIVGTDPLTDIAVIKIGASRLPAVSFGNSDSSRIGEWVLAIGNPLGEGYTFTVTAGIISAKGRLLGALQQSRYSIQDFIQTDAAINPGNSGGPLVNVRGEVIGINSAIASETGFYAGYGFAIPINLARTVMTQLIETGHVGRAVMGISIRPITPEDAELAKLREIRGVVVQDFTPPDNSPARRAGIQEGDVIVAVDGEAIESMSQLMQKVGFRKPGDPVEVTVVRPGGERKTVTVRLAAAPGAEADTERLASVDDGTRRRGVAPKEEALGISVEPLSQEDAQEPGLRVVARAGGGLVVTDVSPDGPAFEKLADATNGVPDIILKVNGAPTRTRAEFRTALAAVKSGDIVTLTVLHRFPDGWQQQIVRLRAR
ncbi:MAG TPA: Do family serine endopeptidase [Gemmatimonadales bacterium]|jgi:serine protease Do|nr:Do family serine endopeptidase [Gemmatimonadales bacterium]